MKEDRRRASLILTAEGRTDYKDVEKFTMRLEQELTAGLDQAETAMLRQILDKLDRQFETRIGVQPWETFLG